MNTDVTIIGCALLLGVTEYYVAKRVKESLPKVPHPGPDLAINHLPFRQGATVLVAMPLAVCAFGWLLVSTSKGRDLRDDIGVGMLYAGAGLAAMGTAWVAADAALRLLPSGTP